MKISYVFAGLCFVVLALQATSSPNREDREKSGTALPKAATQLRDVSGSSSPYANLGELTFAATEFEERTSKFRPAPSAIESALEESFRSYQPKGKLPGRVVVMLNSFDSAYGAGVVYSIQMSLVRPTVILGSTQVIDANVITTIGVGRTSAAEAQSFILEHVKQMAKDLADAIAAGPTNEF